MRKRRWVILILSLAAFLQAGEMVEWTCKDGTGSKIVKSTQGAGLDGIIAPLEKLLWAQADDRGFFLNLAGATISVPHSEKLFYPDGFILDAEFSCDFAAAPKQKWFGLLSKGRNYSSGYAVLINRNGSICLSVKLDQKNIWIDKQANLQGNRDYKLKIAVGDGKASIWLDGKLLDERAYHGQLADTGDPFFISPGYYPFFGNIYHVKLSPYSANLLPTDASRKVEIKRPLPPDPPGTVIVNDFFHFSPRPQLVPSRSAANWGFRTNFKLRQSLGVLFPPELDREDLVFDPQLKGKYDVLVIGRSVSDTTKLQFKLDENNDYYRIVLPGSGSIHQDVDILVDRGIDMTGKKISIAAGNFFYLGCFKFIPAGASATWEASLPGILVDRGPRWGKEEAIRQINDKIASGYFIERHFVETRREPTPKEESIQRGFLLFRWNYLRHLFPESVPESDEGTPTLKISTALGEYEPLLLGIRGLREVGEIRASITGFPKSIQVRAGVVRNVAKRTTNYQNSSEFMVAPQYIENTNCLTVNSGQSGLFWFTVFAANDTPGGVYHGVIELQGAAGRTEVPVELLVHSFRLEPLSGYDIGFHYTAVDEHTIRQDIRDMAAHGMSSIWVHSQALLDFNNQSPPDIYFEDSTISALCEEFRQCGMTGNIYLYADAFNTLSARHPEIRDEIYSRLIKQLETHGKANNWPKFFYTSWDEVLSSPQRLADFQWEIKLLKSLSVSTWANHLWYKTVRPYEKELAEIVPYVDVFNLRYNNRSLYYVDSWETIQAEVAKRGKILHDYNPNAALVFAQPAAMRFNGGWFFRSTGKNTSGKCIYTYREFSGSPFNDLDGIDWIYNFPAAEGSHGGFSIDYECFREGIDDLRYILTLENRIQKAEEKQADVSQAREVLHELTGSFDLDQFRQKSLFVSSVWDRNWEDASGKRLAAGDFNLPNGWTLENYDQARMRLVDSIVKLQEKLQ